MQRFVSRASVIASMIALFSGPSAFARKGTTTTTTTEAGNRSTGNDGSYDDEYDQSGYNRGGSYQDDEDWREDDRYDRRGHDDNGRGYGHASCDAVYCSVCRNQYGADHFLDGRHVGFLLHSARRGDVFYPQEYGQRLESRYAGASALYFCGQHVHNYRFGGGYGDDRGYRGRGYGDGRGYDGRRGSSCSSFGPSLELEILYALGHAVLHGHGGGEWGHNRWNWSGDDYGRRGHRAPWQRR